MHMGQVWGEYKVDLLLSLSSWVEEVNIAFRMDLILSTSMLSFKSPRLLCGNGMGNMDVKDDISWMSISPFSSSSLLSSNWIPWSSSSDIAMSISGSWLGFFLESAFYMSRKWVSLWWKSHDFDAYTRNNWKSQLSYLMYEISENCKSTIVLPLFFSQLIVLLWWVEYMI